MLLLLVKTESEELHNLGDDVLLPCNCADRDLKEGFKWQTENPPSLIFKVKPTEEINWGNYKTRVQMFVNESSNDCSILLKNITEDDNKTYTCRFKNGVFPPDIPRVVTSPRQYLTIIPALVLLLMGCIVGFIGITYL
uniref:Ig-like domain-containing protein n=1 Tax=Fundulus heteroclitus TaxID=8078 RepID=A0A3Q2QUL4_FUNHE